MKVIKHLTTFIIALAIIGSGCKNMNKTQKGAVIGTATGAAMGAIVGKATGNTALGTIIGAAVGGVTGTLIGKKMDKQAEELKKQVPDAKVERVGEGIVVEFNNNVLFGFDRSDLTSDASQTLNKLTTVLNSYPDTDIEIQGHTDSKGTEKYNQNLSVRRASAVSSYLTTHSISGSRITVKGFGESSPKYSNDTEDGRAGNRRVEFLITANEKMKADAKKEAANN